MKRDLLTLSDLNASELQSLLQRALFFKKNQTCEPILKNKVLGVIFEKSSTRTRVSFEVAMYRLGGKAVVLEGQTIQISRGETYADTAKVLSRYVNALVLRTYSQENLEDLAKNASVPVINGLTDLYHPCQILADLMTILEQKKNLDNLTISYIGDGNNMTNTWIEAALMLPFHLVVSCPPGYGLSKNILNSIKGKTNIEIFTDPIKGVTNSDVVNTDTWFSMGQKVSVAKKKAFKKFQINKKLLSYAKRDALVLHCLPAHRGEEITDEVIDGKQSAVFDEAENRLYVQMALLEFLMR